VTAVDSVVVVIPARNEEELVGACLRAVARAVAHTHTVLGERAPLIRVEFVADHCTDSTAVVARGFDGVRVLERATGAPVGNVGAARAAGVTAGLDQIAGPRDRVWLAHTDADSRVPENWIVEQLAMAADGADLMVGTVRPDFADLSPSQVMRWNATHFPGQPNGHVHGANLGIRADLYLAAGGFLPQSEHEDVDLARRALLAGARSVPTDCCEVITSGRSVGRTPGGYAAFLRSQGTVAPGTVDGADDSDTDTERAV
jgi:glycosyltransferase involved in cell wall biosynthesis